MVLGLAETNCTSDNKNLYNIPNFTSFYQDVRQVNGVNKKKGTGVALYVHNSLNAVLDTENSFNTRRPRATRFVSGAPLFC